MLKEIEGSQFIFVGGKGGVGKTTIASSIAVALAKHGRKVLIFSTDPVHALPDTLDRTIRDSITPIRGLKNLFALQSNPERLLREFMEKHRDVLMKIVEEGTYFDRDDIEQLLALSLPGLDELMAIMKIIDLQKEREFDHYIFDTAPTGHTIRLLQLPAMMENWLRVLSKMKQKSVYIRAVLVGRYMKDEADKFLEAEGANVSAVKKLLSDGMRTQFIPVIIPEAMALEETADLFEALSGCGMHVRNIVVNNVVPSTNCEACSARRCEQLKYMRKIKSAYPDCEITKVPLFPHPVKGISKLLAFGGHLFKDKAARKYATRRIGMEQIVFKRSNLLDLLESDTELLIFGGKGGVGKTTCACATALALAKKRRVMIFSTDPAHSISDSFAERIGSEIRHVKDGLYALEMNAEELLQQLKDLYRNEIREVFEGFFVKLRSQGIHMDVAFDREIMEDLFSLAPPGLDELMALKKIMDLRKEGRYDMFVLDTAPTTHALRLLEMPNLAREWFRAFNEIQCKYSGVVSLDKTAQLVESLQKDVEDIRLSITDPKKTEFVVVTIPEAVPVEETGRLIRRLASLGVHTRHMIVNRVVPASKCEYCRARRGEQEKHLQQMHRRFSNLRIREMPQFSSEVRGIDDLERYAKILYAKEDLGAELK